MTAKKATEDQAPEPTPDPYDQAGAETAGGGTPPPPDANLEEVPEAGDKATQTPPATKTPAKARTTRKSTKAKPAVRAGDRIETYTATKPDGSKVTVTRNLDTGEHKVS